MRLARVVALPGLFILLYLVTAPDVVNLDGLGYLKLLPHNFAAGHLLYMPLLRTATRLLRGNGVLAGRLLSALGGGAAIALTESIGRRTFSQPTVGLFAAAGLGLSYGLWVEACDVEVYACATAVLLMTVRLALAYRARPTWLGATLVGLALGVAVLFHLTHLLLVPFVAVALVGNGRTKLGPPALALVVGGSLTLGLYGYAACVVRGQDLGGALAWIGTASHGFRYQGGIYRLADAIYGLAKSVVASPYLYESDAPKLLGQFLLGLAPLVALGVLAAQHRILFNAYGRQGRLALAWATPYAVMGMLFFGSDSERWVFILPLLWLLAGVLLAALPDRRQPWVAGALLLYIGGLNFATAILPAHADRWTRRRAEVVDSLLHDGDFLLFPGHSWDEYPAFYANGRRIEPFPFAYYAARDGLASAFERLDRDSARVRAHGGRLFALRIFDDTDEDPRGFDELRALGLSRSELAAQLKARFQPTPLTPISGLRMDRLDPPRAP